MIIQVAAAKKAFVIGFVVMTSLLKYGISILSILMDFPKKELLHVESNAQFHFARKLAICAGMLYYLSMKVNFHILVF